jgi:hypothetical protein
MFRSYDHVQAEICTLEIKMTGLFYSNYSLYVSVVRPSLSGNMYLTNYVYISALVVRSKHVADNLNEIVNNY